MLLISQFSVFSSNIVYLEESEIICICSGFNRTDFNLELKMGFFEFLYFRSFKISNCFCFFIVQVCLK